MDCQRLYPKSNAHWVAFYVTPLEVPAGKNLAKKHKSNIAGRGPDFQDQPKLAVECVNQYL